MRYPQENRLRFELFLPDGDDRAGRFAGYAFKSENEPFYVVRLNMFPNITYFLARNSGSTEDFMVFSRCVRAGEETKLLNPVGVGKSDPADTTYMKLSFFMLPGTLYMSLLPKE